MHYDSVFDKWHEECGVFGIFDRHLNVGHYTYWGLFALHAAARKVPASLLAMGKPLK